MELLKKNGIIVFWAILFADCFFLYNENSSYHGYFKLALIPILVLYIFLNARKKHYLVSKSLVFMGMLFAWVGDLLLLNNSNSFFIAGIVAFFITHIFYIVFFFRLQPLNIQKSSEAILAALILGFIGYKLYGFLQPDLVELPNLRFLLMGYGIAISLMAVLATNVLSNKSKKPLALGYFIPGAALFIFSGIVMVISRFKFTDESYLQIVITISYGYGQCLLGQGFAKHLKG